jgi:hypothetical protein
MTPKEKANRLCIDFLMDIHTDERDFGMNKEMAKQCALIAVDEIIKTLKPPCLTEFDYWQQVKHEIKNI